MHIDPRKNEDNIRKLIFNYIQDNEFDHYFSLLIPWWNFFNHE